MKYFVYHFQVFLLIMMRMNSMMVIAPLFSSGVIPFRINAVISFLITLVIFPIISAKGYNIPGDMGGYLICVIREISIGIYIGFLVAIIFAAFQMSSEYFSVQTGFGISEVLDPLAQISIPVIGQLQNLIGLLVFLAINGHHFLIKAIYRSYELAPLLTLDGGGSSGLLKFMVHTMSGMFVIALKIALPVVGTIFLISISLGILAKAAPQMNIFMLGFPLKIAVAFGVLILTTPLIIRIMSVSLDRTFRFISKVLIYWPA